MEVYLYLDRNTFFHRLDPRTKIFLTGFLFIWSLIFNHPFYLAVLFIFILSLAVLSRCLENLKKLWIILVLLFVFSTIFWPFFLKGEISLFRIGRFNITKEAVFYAISMGFRLTCMLIAGIIFLSTTTIEEFTEALQKIGVPFALSFAISFAFRLVPTFLTTASTVFQAQKSRGLDFTSGGIIKRIIKHIPLIIPIFVYAIRNTNFLAMALEVKGFGKNIKREPYIELQMKISDWIVIIISFTILTISFYLRLKGFGIVTGRI